MSDDEKYYQLGLASLPGIGDVLANRLVAHFGTAQAIFKANHQELKSVPGIDQNRVAQIKNGFSDAPIEKELKFMAQEGISLLSWPDDKYPHLLKEIPDAPFLLFSKGNANLDFKRPLAIVGSRQNSAQGKAFTEKILEELQVFQPEIISGLAYGIDYIAHKKALDLGLPTFAVLAHGLDRIYPSTHKNVALKMLENGAWISEYPSGTNPDRQNFPSRNRIVAGLSAATLVIETAEKGGAMITAKLALSYNREVFAVPGRYNDAVSAGCNYLIKRNIAHLLTEANDIAEILNWPSANASPLRAQAKLFPHLSTDETLLLSHLREKTAVHIDELQIKTNWPASKLASVLLQLEFSGIVNSLPGKRYKII